MEHRQKGELVLHTHPHTSTAWTEKLLRVNCVRKEEVIRGWMKGSSVEGNTRKSPLTERNQTFFERHGLIEPSGDSFYLKCICLTHVFNWLRFQTCAEEGNSNGEPWESPVQRERPFWKDRDTAVVEREQRYMRGDNRRTDPIAPLSCFRRARDESLCPRDEIYLLSSFKDLHICPVMSCLFLMFYF